MNDGPVVSNASPLIALAGIGRLDVLQQLFETVLVPPAVVRECRSIPELPDWIEQRALQKPVHSWLQETTLGAGEREAIALAAEVRAQWVLLDDRAARKAAEALGLEPMGTLGVFLAAKEHGLVQAIRPHVSALVADDLWITQSLVDRALAAAGEVDP